MPEVWRSIPDIPEYEASSLGRIRRIVPYGARPLKEALKPSLNTHGYPFVSICTGGRKVSKNVHSLVCAAFHGPRPAEMDVAHWDNDQTNSRPDNLRWATRRDNILDKHRHGTMARGERHSSRTHPEKIRRGERHPHAKLTDDAVREIRSPGLTQVQAAKKFGISQTNVSDVRKGRTWKHVQQEQPHV